MQKKLIQESIYLPINADVLWLPNVGNNKFNQLYFKWKKIKEVKQKNHYFGQYSLSKGNGTINILKDNATSKFVKYSINKGMYIKAYKNFLIAMRQIYKLTLYDKSETVKVIFGGYSPVLSYLMCTTFMFNTTTILNWASKSISQIFIFKCFKASKYLKKRTKKKYSLKALYLNRRFRLNNALKRISFFVETRKYNNLSSRIFFALGDVFFLYKNGELYRKKLLIYKKVFNTLKNFK